MALNAVQSFLMSGTLCLATIMLAASNQVPVRLVGGPDPFEGRVEVFHDGAWGSVCDDGWDNNENNGCPVVCNQLGYNSGQMRKDAVTFYGMGTGQIHLDDVKCDGDEANIGECQHKFWGDNDCLHKEDVGCICKTASGTGTCDQSHHRITPINPVYPGIGRVEVRNDSGEWMSICDDHWDDQDAAVFCDCLGYTNSQYFRAYWSEEIGQVTPALSHLYSKVHCHADDSLITKNIWDCQTEIDNGLCTAGREAAGVACQTIPATIPPAPPAVEMICDGEDMTVCFKSSTYSLSSSYLSLNPSCQTPHAVARNITDGVCYDIHMDECESKDIKTDSSFKHYCYDISYSQFDTDPNLLITDNIWTRKACCSVEKNGTVVGSFLPSSHEIHSAVYEQAPANLTLQCYEDETFSGPPLECPANVTRGQEIYCKVSAQTWDSQLQLIVPSCKFLPTSNAQQQFTFIKDKCPQSPGLELTYFGLDSHNWGFKFLVPKFQGHDTLHLSCDCYLCDYILDHKPYCDRSCLSDKSGARRRRDITTEINGATRGKAALEVHQGPFVISEDSGFGPIISHTGKLEMVTLDGADEREGLSHAGYHDTNAVVSSSPGFIIKQIITTLAFLITVSLVIGCLIL